MASGSLLFDGGGCYDSKQFIGVSFAHRWPTSLVALTYWPVAALNLYVMASQV